MHTIANRPSAPSQALLLIMAVLQQITARVREAQQTFNARWEERARTSIAIRELTSLGERDLRDMGISRGDIPRLVREERNWRQA